MAKAADKTKKPAPDGDAGAMLRRPAEIEYAAELDALRATDRNPRPDGWLLSPKAVRTYILGGKAGNTEIRPKYLGSERVVEIAIATLATDRALLLVGEPGTAKCLKHDTMVVDTRTGERVTIEEACQRRDLSVASLDENWQLRPQVAADYLANGIRPCYRVTTHLGREIEVTINHPFLTLGGWQKLGELTVGDRIALPRALPYFGSAHLSDARVILLAHLIAEGCLTQNLAYFSNKNPEMQRDFSDAVAAAFPELRAHWHPSGRECSVSRAANLAREANPCTAWLRRLGLMGTGSATKFVPECVFSLPRGQIALFLNRLFSGDGCLHRRRTTGQFTVDYCSKSQRLVKDVQHLLLRFGINARYSRRKTGHYRLYIHDRGPCLMFLREIGFLDRQRTAKAVAQIEAEACRENPNLDVIPSAIWGRIERVAQATGYRNASALVKAERGDAYKGGGPRQRQSVSRPRLLRLATFMNDSGLASIARSDIYWDAIKKIEFIGRHRVYDLNLTRDHNFVANDIVVHNSWLSEHLAAAISGNSLLLIQGTAGTTEEQIRYSWNYALLLAEGPSPKALVPSPMYRAMEDGKLVRFEEISRCPSEVQDSLITLLSEKVLAIPELNLHLPGRRGFNLIATANTRDRGVNDMSAALTRRFNKVMLPVPQDVDTEVAIVQKRVAEIGAGLKLPAPPPAEEAVRKIVQIFQELRAGQTLDGKQKVKPPSGVLSTAEAISLVGNSMALAGHFGDGAVADRDLAAGLHGVIIKEDARDAAVWVEYLENIMKKRGAEWRDLYNACKELTS
ncbi:MAG TPA: AAA family ATPase [Gemmataceae bacterium]|nr:AAA family ATPase [Gemmataceae bacterium]